MTIPRSHRPGFLNPVCQIVEWSLTFRVKNVFEKKKWKKPGLWDRGMVWSLADWVKNLIEKNWPDLSDSDMVTGGLMRVLQ